MGSHFAVHDAQRFWAYPSIHSLWLQMPLRRCWRECRMVTGKQESIDTVKQRSSVPLGGRQGLRSLPRSGDPRG
jgi:hypothetical protein